MMAEQLEAMQPARLLRRVPRQLKPSPLTVACLVALYRAFACRSSVDPQGPGAAAGIHQGDIIVAWNGEPIRQVQSLLRALGPDGVGQTVKLWLRRGGKTKEIPLTIAERLAA